MLLQIGNVNKQRRGQQVWKYILKNEKRPTTAKYPQVGGFRFVDRKPVFEKQYFVGSSSGNSRPACICGTLWASIKSAFIDNLRVKTNRKYTDEIMIVDTEFNVHSDAGGGDPDITSPTLRLYHKILWSKPLPNG